MADPISIGLAIGGALISTIGAISQGISQSNADKFNAEAAERNAILARQQAAQDAEAKNRENRRRLGSIRAQIGAAGLDAEGSPLDIIESSAFEAKLDELNIIYKGELRAAGFLDTAALDRQSADVAIGQGILRGASGFLTGAGKTSRIISESKA